MWCFGGCGVHFVIFILGCGVGGVHIGKFVMLVVFIGSVVFVVFMLWCSFGSVVLVVLVVFILDCGGCGVHFVMFPLGFWCQCSFCGVVVLMVLIMWFSYGAGRLVVFILWGLWCSFGTAVLVLYFLWCSFGVGGVHFVLFFWVGLVLVVFILFPFRVVVFVVIILLGLWCSCGWWMFLLLEENVNTVIKWNRTFSDGFQEEKLYGCMTSWWLMMSYVRTVERERKTYQQPELTARRPLTMYANPGSLSVWSSTRCTQWYLSLYNLVWVSGRPTWHWSTNKVFLKQNKSALRDEYSRVTDYPHFFTMSISPLSKELSNTGYGYQLDKQTKFSHLFYADDLKQYGTVDKQLNRVVNTEWYLMTQGGVWSRQMCQGYLQEMEVRNLTMRQQAHTGTGTRSQVHLTWHRRRWWNWTPKDESQNWGGAQEKDQTSTYVLTECKKQESCRQHISSPSCHLHLLSYRLETVWDLGTRQVNQETAMYE